MREYLRPWKLLTLATGVTLLIAGAFHFQTYDWDVGISVIMAVLAYLTAPWALRIAWDRRWRLYPAALFAYWLTVDGSYVAYNAWRGHPVAPELRHANFFASTALYLICGVLWLPRLTAYEALQAMRKAPVR